MTTDVHVQNKCSERDLSTFLYMDTCDKPPEGGVRSCSSTFREFQGVPGLMETQPHSPSTESDARLSPVISHHTTTRGNEPSAWYHLPEHPMSRHLLDFQCDCALSPGLSTQELQQLPAGSRGHVVTWFWCCFGRPLPAQPAWCCLSQGALLLIGPPCCGSATKLAFYAKAFI